MYSPGCRSVSRPLDLVEWKPEWILPLMHASHLCGVLGTFRPGMSNRALACYATFQNSIPHLWGRTERHVHVRTHPLGFFDSVRCQCLETLPFFFSHDRLLHSKKLGRDRHSEVPLLLLEKKRKTPNFCCLSFFLRQTASVLDRKSFFGYVTQKRILITVFT